MCRLEPLETGLLSTRVCLELIMCVSNDPHWLFKVLSQNVYVVLSYCDLQAYPVADGLSPKS